MYDQLMQILRDNDIEPGWFWSVAVPVLVTWIAGLWQSGKWTVGAVQWTWGKWCGWCESRQLAAMEAEDKRTETLLNLMEKRLQAKRVPPETPPANPSGRYACSNCNRTGTYGELCGHNHPRCGKPCISNNNPQNWKEVTE